MCCILSQSDCTVALSSTSLFLVGVFVGVGGDDTYWKELQNKLALLPALGLLENPTVAGSLVHAAGFPGLAVN